MEARLDEMVVSLKSQREGQERTLHSLSVSRPSTVPADADSLAGRGLADQWLPTKATDADSHGLKSRLPSLQVQPRSSHNQAVEQMRVLRARERHASRAATCIQETLRSEATHPLPRSMTSESKLPTSGSLPSIYLPGHRVGRREQS